MKKIAIISGKGGTGKTMVATALFKLMHAKKHTKLIDLDVDCPNAQVYLTELELQHSHKTHVIVPEFVQERCTSCGICEEKCNFKALSLFKGVVTVYEELCKSCNRCINECPTNALIPKKIDYGIINHYTTHNNNCFIEGVLHIGDVRTKNLIVETKKSALEQPAQYAIYDAPPGTTCPMVAAVLDSDLVILIAEDSPYGLSDLKLALSVVQEMKLPHEIVINKHNHKNSIVDTWAKENSIQISARIPYDEKIHHIYSNKDEVLEIPEVRKAIETLAHIITGDAS